METITDISIERTKAGTPTYIKLDYNKYASLLQHFMYELGVDISLVLNPATEQAIEEARNVQALKKYTSAEELLADCLK